MTKRLAGLGLAFCLLAPSAWAAPDPVVRMSVAVCDPNNPSHCSAPNASGQITAADPNNASYTTATAITVGGASISATRGVAADCTAGGTATLTMSGSGTISWTVAVGHQNQPYSITAISASTATCSFYGLN